MRLFHAIIRRIDYKQNLILDSKDNLLYLIPMNKDKIKYLLQDIENTPIPDGFPREIELPMNSRKVVILLGLRRVGKTYLLYSTMRRLMASGISRGQLLYLNFEDDRLAPITAGDLDTVFKCHKELHPELSGLPIYFFFDEVQAVPGWEKFVRRLHDTERGDIFITGSSSALMVRDVATSMRGRSIQYEVFPLSFKEFLSFRGARRQPYSSDSDTQMRRLFEEFIEIGGLPEVVLAIEEIRSRILKDYCDLIFYRDLVDRYRLSNEVLLKELLGQVLGHPASLLNNSKVERDLKSRGLVFGKDTLHRYLSVMEESYIFFSLPVAARSLRKRSVNPRKIHPVDWSLGYWMYPRRMIDRGHRLETMIYLHIRRQRQDLGYVKVPHEIDLVVGIENPECYINVTWDSHESAVLERELAGLTQPGISGSAKRLLVSHNTAERPLPAGVQEVEAYRFLLDEHLAN